jgi:hypothetical protein
MLLIYGTQDRPEQGEPGYEEALARVNAFAEECARRGALVAGEPLRPVDTATTVRVRDGQTLLTDGPFAETHEHLCGYYLLDCRNLDDALELAARCPMAVRGSIEVRPVDELPGMVRPGSAQATVAES